MDDLITSARATMRLQPGDVIRVETIIDRPFPILQTLQTVTGVVSLILLDGQPVFVKLMPRSLSPNRSLVTL